MKIIYCLLFTILVIPSFSQSNDLLNDDGTISEFAKRKIFVEAFRSMQTEDRQYEIQDKYFVIISKDECLEKEYDSNEIQKEVMLSSFWRLLNTINSLQKRGFSTFTDLNFKGIIFKINNICMLKTRRYHFEFSFIELNNFPEYLDFEELFSYVIKNDNRNIIYIKNDK